jgi:hypothetical protein
MKRAEKIIRQQIDTLSMDSIATQKHELEQAIKWFHWQGTFRTKKFNQLNELLTIKYTEIMNKYYEDFMRKDKADFERFKKLYDIED